MEAEAAVKDLYDFVAHYLEKYGVDSAAKKWDEVKVQMERTVKLLDSLEDTLSKVQYLRLKGRALNVLPDHSQEAEACLSQAIKHDPSLEETWNALGESYWKAGKIQQAHDCFSSSLAHSRNKESLRNLSMVLRQMGKDASEKEENAKKSLERAKEAVALDVKDGNSWMILGNAHLSLIFMVARKDSSSFLKHCISAYTQAEKDPITANNPDLHYNRATLCQYEEDYQEMIKRLQSAASLDPSWMAPKERLKSTWKFLTSMSYLIANKGKVKSKVMSGILDALSTPDRYTGDGEGDVGKGRKIVPLAELKEGTNEGAVVVVGMAAVVPSQDRVPYGCVVLDRLSECLGLTMYNLASSTHFSPGKILAIPDPILCVSTVEYNGDVVEFRNIQVTDPSKLLLNGQKLSADKLARSTVSVSAFS